MDQRQKKEFGKRLRKERNEKGFSQKGLADQAKVSRDTISNIGCAGQIPQPRNMKSIANVLETTITELMRGISKPLSQNPVRVKVNRFIPLFIGNQKNIDLLQQNMASNKNCKQEEYHFFEDGFLVIIQHETLEFSSIAETLGARRKAHLQILENKEKILKGIKISTDHPLFGDQPPSVDYVMSVYQLLNPDDHEEHDFLALCEPSLVGITDDPHLHTEPEEIVYFTPPPEGRRSLISNKISEIQTKNCTFYVSWSNVVLTDENENSADYKRLEMLELQLQKLWFQMNSYDSYLDRCILFPENYDRNAVAREINNAQLHVSNFCKVDSVSSGHVNDLKNALVETSRLRNLSNSVSKKLKML